MSDGGGFPAAAPVLVSAPAPVPGDSSAPGRRCCWRLPRSGLGEDVRGRWPWYYADWLDGVRSGCRILGPATYIFFASVIPAIAFGAQLSESTGGLVTGVQVLLATGLCGVIQALLGGQPLLIVGVAEPIVLLWGYLYAFASNQSGLGPELFLPWAAWCCVWAAAILVLVTLLGASRLTSQFTPFAGEMFGLLIAMLFIQEAVKGAIQEFRAPTQGQEMAMASLADEYAWRLVNGFWGLILAFGLLLTSLLMRTAEGWTFGVRSLRSLVAEYGVPLMVLAWTLLSYALRGAPSGVPRRLAIPDLWTDYGFWSTARDMGALEGQYVAMALIPGLLIAILFFFDHNVSSLMGQGAELNLLRPPAYNWDMLLLSLMTLMCGLLGLPPVNGVLPQTPMHSKALADHHRRGVNSALLTAHKLSRQGDVEEAARLLIESAAAMNEGTAEAVRTWLHEHPGQVPSVEVLEGLVPIGVTEQRITGLLQSAAVTACAAATPVLRKIPTSILWGYFAFMAIDSMPGNGLWERMQLVITDPSLYLRRNKAGHQPYGYLRTVPIWIVIAFTAVQFSFLAGVYGITTWTGVVGIIFPLPILLMVPLRRFVLPRVFRPSHLHALDPASYDAPDGVPADASWGAAPLPAGSVADSGSQA